MSAPPRVLALAAAGVRIEDPATTLVGLDVVVEPDAVLRPFTILEGRTIVRAGAVRRPLRAAGGRRGRARARRSSTTACCASAWWRRARSVGPFAHMRPTAAIGARAQGRQLRRAQEDARSARAPRRRTCRYLGDATIGPGREHRRRHHHLQLRRRPQAPDAHRGRRLRRQRHDARGARSRSGRAPTSPRAAPSPRTCPQDALALGPRAAGDQAGLGRARGAQRRRRRAGRRRR